MQPKVSTVSTEKIKHLAPITIRKVVAGELPPECIGPYLIHMANCPHCADLFRAILTLRVAMREGSDG